MLSIVLEIYLRGGLKRKKLLEIIYMHWYFLLF